MPKNVPLGHWTRVLVTLIPLVLGARASTSLAEATSCNDRRPNTSIIPQKDGFIDRNGKIYYVIAGSGAPLVFIHDGALSSEVWDGQVAYFKACRRVVRYDRRGYGNSPPAKSPFSNIEDLRAVIQATRSEGAVLVAGSMGGMLAIDYTLQYPQDVSGLVLVGPIVSGLPLSDHFNERMRALMGTTSTMTIRNFSDDRYVLGPNSDGLRPAFAKLMLKSKAALETDPVLFAAAWQPKRPALANLHEIKVPTLILAGEYDIPDVHAHSGAIEAGIVGAKRLVVSDAGHLIYFEQPETFNRLLAEFLGKH